MRSAIAFVVLLACGDDGPGPEECVPKPGVATQYGRAAGPNEGVTVCIEGTDECDTSVLAGTEATFSLCMPDEAVAVRASKPTFETALFLVPAGASTVAVEIGDITGVAPFWEPIGAEYPPTTNGLLVGIVRGDDTMPRAGATVDPTSAGAVVYGDELQFPSTSLTATTSSGIFYVADVPPGEHDVIANVPGLPTCELDDLLASALGGFESTVPGGVRVPVIAGVVTLVVIRCRP